MGAGLVPTPSFANSRGNQKKLEGLDIEQESDYVSILDDVILAFCPEQASFACLS
jgi:hypothetical protein